MNKKIKKPERREGWQFWIDIYEDHVIKTPKKRREMRKHVKAYLDRLGKSHKIEETVDKGFRDVVTSTRLIKKSKAPMKYFAYPEFLKKGKLKQKRVTCIDDKLRELNNKGKKRACKKIINKFIKFMHELWKYGLHETPMKFNLNFGLDKNKVVLIDLFELTGNKSKVQKQIRKKVWVKHKRNFINSVPEWIIDYYIKQANKKFTLKNLDKYWKKKIK